jgi:hypothetical protein
MSARFNCPVCGYGNLTEPPYDLHGCGSFEICPCCGTEFGYDDVSRSHADLTAAWLALGAQWWSKTTPRPARWNALDQLRAAGLLN